jgi:hypothetical protein
VDLDAEGGDVLLLELAGQMALDEGGLDLVSGSREQLRGDTRLSSAAIADKDELEGRVLLLLSHGCLGLRASKLAKQRAETRRGRRERLTGEAGW